MCPGIDPSGSNPTTERLILRRQMREKKKTFYYYYDRMAFPIFIFLLFSLRPLRQMGWWQLRVALRLTVYLNRCHHCRFPSELAMVHLNGINRVDSFHKCNSCRMVGDEADEIRKKQTVFVRFFPFFARQPRVVRSTLLAYVAYACIVCMLYNVKSFSIPHLFCLNSFRSHIIIWVSLLHIFVPGQHPWNQRRFAIGMMEN